MKLLVELQPGGEILLDQVIPFYFCQRDSQTTVPSEADDDDDDVDTGRYHSFFLSPCMRSFGKRAAPSFVFLSFYPSDDIQLKCLFTVKVVVAAVVFSTDSFLF